MIKKKLINLYIISMLVFNQIYSSEELKYEETLNSWFGNIGPYDVQELICQYLDKWESKELDFKFQKIKKIKKIKKSPDGKMLACISDDNIKLFDISNIANIRQLNTIELLTMGYKPNSLDISENGKYIAIGYHLSSTFIFSRDIPNKGKIEIFDINSEKINKNKALFYDPIFSQSFTSPVCAVKFLSQNFLLVNHKDSAQIRNIFDISDLNKVFLANTLTIPHCSESNEFILTQNNQYLLEIDRSNYITIWDCKNLPNLKETSSFINHVENGNYIRGLAISNDNKKLASLDFSTLKIWNTEDFNNPKCIFADVQAKNKVGNMALAFSPNNKYLACAQNNSTIKIYDLEDYNKIHTYICGQGYTEINGINFTLGSVVFSDDGNAIIFASNNNKLNVAINLAMLLKINNALTRN